MKKILKNKAVVYLVILLLIFSANVFADFTIRDTGTDNLTFTDISLTTDGSTFKLDFANDWMRADNGTFTSSVTVAGRVLDNTDFNSWDTGTPGRGDYEITKIMNSKGNNWTVTEANLATAIADVGSYGWVTVGANFTLTSPILIRSKIKFDLYLFNHVVTLNGDIEFINITASLHFGLHDAVVRVNSGTPQTGGIITLYSNSWANRVDDWELDNIYIDNAGGRREDSVTGLDYYIEHNYTGIKLFADGPAADRIDSGIARDVWMEGCGIGIYMYMSGNSYLNGNKFDNIYLDEFETGLQMVGDGHSENVFEHFKMQCNPITLYGLRMNGGDNIFREVHVWDWNKATVCPDGIYQFWFESDSVRCDVEAHVCAQTNTKPDDFRNDGRLNKFKAGNVGELDYDADYDYKFRVDADSGFYYVRQGERGMYASGGTLDESKDFEALLETVCNNDDIVVKFENGTYYFDSGVTVDGKNITFEGRDDHTTIFKCNATSYGSGLFIMNGYSDSNITWRNIVFDGEDCTDTSIALYFSSNENTYGLKVENCIFRYWTAGTSKAIYVRPSTSDTVTNVKITDSEFEKCDYGVFFDGDADPSIIQLFDVSHNYFDECLYSIFCDYAFNSTITTNRMTSTVAGADGITLSNCYDVIVSNNVVIVTDDGIIESGTSNYNNIGNNGCRHSGDPITVVGANTVNQHNT